MKRHKPNAGWFRKYGFSVILLALFLSTVVAFWHQSYAAEREEHKTRCDFAQAANPDAKCPPFEGSSARTQFWNGIWENMESEFAQLFVQFLGMVAFARWIAYKQEEDFDELKDQIDELRAELKRD